jgi:predicted transcriptional regulator
MSGPVWHRAAATIGADEEVARELDAIAEDAQRRGAIAAAVEALEHAAELTRDSDLTAGCLLGVAEWAVALGGWPSSVVCCGRRNRSN